MKKVFLIIFLLAAGFRLLAQKKVIFDSIPVNPPHYFINTDLVLDIEYIPTIGYEQFFAGKKRLKSWHVDLSYQVHYNDQFGGPLSHGDRVSIGVYQGPVVKYGYRIYRRRHRKNWQNYIAPGLIGKYLWYDNERVNTGKRTSDPSFKIQSEKCYAIVPQITVGAKHANKWFCADFYGGLQFPIKRRDKTIYVDDNSLGIPNPAVPYTNNRTNISIAPVLGIRIGYIK